MENAASIQKPSTPKPKEDVSDEERDHFEDAPDITPRPRTQSASRSLTGADRRPSSSGSVNKENARKTPDHPEVDGKPRVRESIPEKPEVLLDTSGSRVSLNTDGMDDVNLGGVSPARASIASMTSTKAFPVHLTKTTSHDSLPPSSASSIISTDKTPTSSISMSAANMARQLKSPFSWLARNQSGADKKLGVTSPIDERRRSDQDSINEDRQSQASLRDRFKAVRLREEAGNTIDDHMLPSSPDTASLTDKIDSPTIENRDSAVSSPTVNVSLPPGMAAGFAKGPTAQPVDWDLWQAVVSEGPAAVARSSPEELTQAIAAGIPQAIRGVIWQVLADSKNEGMERLYRDLVTRGTEQEKPANGHALDVNGNGKDKESIASSSSSIHSNVDSGDGFTNPQAPKPKSAREEHAHIQVLEKTIRRDLGGRTSYSKYLMSSGLQDGLFGICKAYALYDEDVGYAQGMNFIAMPLLFNLREEEAFCLFVKIMFKYGLREMFTQDMPGLHLHLYQFERLLEDYEPALYCHLNRRGVTPNLYATQWLLTLFAYRFPLQLVQRIYDLILSGSLEVSILKFAIVLMQKNKDALLAMKDMSQISSFLKEKLFDVYIDKTPSSSSILESGFFGSTSGIDKEVYKADLLVQDACAVHIDEDMLKLYTAEWEEKRRVEKERETELENLRTQCASLTLKVRRLEERVEKSDIEHVQVASELVRTKVENEKLQDENESLQTQVEELKNVVSRQTEEVEQRLRAEMDDVMKRNSEVHNANRAIEEEKEEMERALVEAKMQYAQVNSEHESLKQRWNTVLQMMK